MSSLPHFLNRRSPGRAPRRPLSALLSVACLVAVVPGASATAPRSSTPASGAACSSPTTFGAGQLSDVVDGMSARETRALAAELGHSAAELDAVAADEALWLDGCGEIYAVDPAPSSVAVEQAERVPVPAASAPLTETFQLHSAPGASRTLYLDFTGETVSGKAWNRQAALGFSSETPFTVAPYSIDDDTSTLNATELASVQQIWAGVAEDFAPFDVDVTTERPSRDALHRSSWTDDEFGLTVLIGAGGAVMDACQCGGIAWVDSYSMVGASADQYEYALVFTEGAGRSGEYLTSTISHESGHTLGLQHDGAGTQGYYSGRAPWSPIMGSGSGPVSQWSRGEYLGANNTEDDLAVIGGHLPAARDDHGDSVAAATPLTAPSASGTVGSSDDVDIFSFVVGELDETTTLHAAPRSLAGGNPNLKVRIEVLDAAGKQLHEARGTVAHSYWSGLSGMDASWTGVLEPGLHHVVVSGDGHGDGVAAGTWSRYGSLGRYSLTVTPTTTSVLTASSLSVAGVAGRPVEAQLVSSGGSAPTTWESVDPLPAGMTLEADGRLHGVPTTAADTSFEVRAVSGRQRVTATVSWLVWASSVFDVAASQRVAVTVGDTVSYRVPRSSRDGGAPLFAPCATCRWPEWASLSSDGTATFTPPSAGVFRLGATVSAGAVSDDVEFVVTVADLVAPAPPAVEVVAGRAASWTLGALAAGASWSKVMGPSWMSVSPAGVVSGTPTQAGRHSYVVRASSGAVRVDVHGSVTVTAPVVTVVRSTAPALTVRATQRRPVNGSVASRRGLSWRVTSGRLPSGTRLDAAGRLTGTPARSGSTTVTVTGSAAGLQVTRRVTLKVAAPVKLAASRSTVTVRRGAKTTVTWRASAGTDPYRFAVVGKLPHGLKFTTSARTVKVSGRPTRRGTHTVRVTVRDLHGSTATRRLVVKVK